MVNLCFHPCMLGKKVSYNKIEEYLKEKGVDELTLKLIKEAEEKRGYDLILLKHPFVVLAEKEFDYGGWDREAGYYIWYPENDVDVLEILKETDECGLNAPTVEIKHMVAMIKKRPAIIEYWHYIRVSPEWAERPMWKVLYIY